MLGYYIQYLDIYCIFQHYVVSPLGGAKYHMQDNIR